MNFRDLDNSTSEASCIEADEKDEFTGYLGHVGFTNHGSCAYIALFLYFIIYRVLRDFNI